MTKEEWIAAACARFTRWASHRRVKGKTGTIEQLRAHIEERIDPPLDARHWGNVTQELARQGVIVKTSRFEAARSSHMSPKPVWRVR